MYNNKINNYKYKWNLMNKNNKNLNQFKITNSITKFNQHKLMMFNNQYIMAYFHWKTLNIIKKCFITK